jgi:hypothetical protein
LAISLAFCGKMRVHVQTSLNLRAPALPMYFRKKTAAGRAYLQIVESGGKARRCASK